MLSAPLTDQQLSALFEHWLKAAQRGERPPVGVGLSSAIWRILTEVSVGRASVQDARDRMEIELAGLAGQVDIP